MTEAGGRWRAGAGDEAGAGGEPGLAAAPNPSTPAGAAQVRRGGRRGVVPGRLALSEPAHPVDSPGRPPPRFRSAGEWSGPPTGGPDRGRACQPSSRARSNSTATSSTRPPRRRTVPDHLVRQPPAAGRRPPPAGRRGRPVRPSMSMPGDSTSPSAYRTSTEPGARDTSAVGYPAEASIPGSRPPARSSTRTRPSGPAADTASRRTVRHRDRSAAGWYRPSPRAEPAPRWCTSVRRCGSAPSRPAAVTFVPLDVPDHRRRRAGRHQVVEIATDLHAVGGRQTAGRRLDPGRRRRAEVPQRSLPQPVRRRRCLGAVEQGPAPGPARSARPAR